MDYLNIGPTPTGENCAQVGSENYYERARAECKAFKAQLLRAFGEPPPGARLKTQANEHDFGTYYEVVVAFDEDDEEALAYALKLEGETPEEWDKQALVDLTAAGYSPR